MSGIEDPGTPPELPEEYADIYRDAYLRALEETPPVRQVPAPEPEHSVVAAAPVDDSSSRLWLVVAIVALLLIVAAYVAGDLLSEEEPEPTGAAVPTSSTTSSSAPRQSAGAGPAGERTERPNPAVSLGPVWDGAVSPVVLAGATASCTAPESVDAANQPVSYAAENAIDEDETTAWRCNGRARGETITFALPTGTAVAEVGLIPGYAKTDPISGTDRYAENNRITKVRWTLADGVVLDQVLDPDPSDRSVQSIRVPVTTTGEVTLEIRAVERGSRNTTAISSVVLGAAT